MKRNIKLLQPFWAGQCLLFFFLIIFFFFCILFLLLCCCGIIPHHHDWSVYKLIAAFNHSIDIKLGYNLCLFFSNAAMPCFYFVLCLFIYLLIHDGVKLDSLFICSASSRPRESYHIHGTFPCRFLQWIWPWMIPASAEPAPCCCCCFSKRTSDAWPGQAMLGGCLLRNVPQWHAFKSLILVIKRKCHPSSSSASSSSFLYPEFPFGGETKLRRSLMQYFIFFFLPSCLSCCRSSWIRHTGVGVEKKNQHHTYTCTICV